jgi:ribosomal peptide maturation radical SAM protein 1
MERVFKIFLINMPFADFCMPSLALTQLKSVLDKKYGAGVSVEISYLNHDFAHYLGIDPYRRIAHSVEALASGIGEWFFRQSTFPELTDNAQDYFQRYYLHRNEQNEAFKRVILERRRGLDNFLSELMTRHNLHRANIVGFSSMFSQNVASLAMARRIKERNSDIITIMGGANCELSMGEEIVKRVEQIDFVFSGPALESLPEFVQYCLDREMEKCDCIQGVLSKANCSSVSPRALSSQPECSVAIGRDRDLDVEINLDYGPFLDAFDRRFPNQGWEPALPFETSRGCWWGERVPCTFCGLSRSTRKYRAMKPEIAIRQFEELFSYFPRSRRFRSVDNIMPKDYPAEVFPFLRTPDNVRIFYEVRVNLTEEDMQVLSKSGVKRIQPGIESLATSTLKSMRKGTTAFQNVLFLKNCLLYGIYPIWNLLVGFPGETEQVYKKYIRDIPSLVHLPPPSGVHQVRFDRYSSYYNEAEKYGLDLHPYDFYELTYPFGKDALANLAYFFMDHNYAADYFVAMVKWISKIKEKVDIWRSKWHDQDQSLLPRLFFKKVGESMVIHDSRYGKVVEHEISSAVGAVMERLVRPRSMANLALSVSDMSKPELEKALEFLLDRGLVFEEGGRFMSVVLPQEPQPMSLDESTISPEVLGEVEDSNGVSREPVLTPLSREAHTMKSSDLKRGDKEALCDRKDSV